MVAAETLKHLTGVSKAYVRIDKEEPSNKQSSTYTTNVYLEMSVGGHPVPAF